jgi:hypothetical protein
VNAVEIEQAITDLAEQPFDRAEFPYAFLEAFGNKPTTIKHLFDTAQLDIEMMDRFRQPREAPREWFLVPLFVIDEAVRRIKDGSNTDYVYDPATAGLSLRRQAFRS